MKNLRYILSALAVIAAVSCSDDEYKPGEPDLADSYDVYFDAGQSSNIAFGMKDKKMEYEITATRNNTTDAISVPVVIKGDESVVFTTPLEFNAGQSTSSFKLVFSDMEIQKPYNFTISIDDPKYALKYGLEATSVNLSVILEDYEKKYSGSYACALLKQPFEVVVEYSAILNKYRVNKTWQGYGDPIVFDWDGKSETISIEKGTSYSTGMDYDGNGNIILATYLDGKYFPKERGFVFVFQYDIPGIGSFGAHQDKLMLR